MEHFHSDWTFKPITMLHVNAPTDSLDSFKNALSFMNETPLCLLIEMRSCSAVTLFGTIFIDDIE